MSLYFRDRGLIIESELFEKYSETVIRIVKRLQNLKDDDDYEKFECENGLHRKLVHLTAESLGYLSNTIIEPEHGIRSCDRCCRVCGINSYINGKKYVIVGKNISVSRKNCATKRRLYYERKVRCQNKDKRKVTLQPKIII